MSSRKKPVSHSSVCLKRPAAAFSFQRYDSASSAKVIREYKSLDTVQCNDIGKLFEALWGVGDNVVDVKQQVKKL